MPRPEEQRLTKPAENRTAVEGYRSVSPNAGLTGKARCERREFTAADETRDDGFSTGPMCGNPARWANCDPVGMPACDDHVCRCRVPLTSDGTQLPALEEP
jgi:hypothetical protein